MTHRGPFQPLPFCDSVKREDAMYDPTRGNNLYIICIIGASLEGTLKERRLAEQNNETTGKLQKA